MAKTSPFQFRDYRAFWCARLASTIANTMLVVVVGLHVYDIARLTMSIREASFWIGMVGLAQFLPLFLLVLVAGYVADRVDRRLIVRLCLAAEMLCAAGLAATLWCSANAENSSASATAALARGVPAPDAAGRSHHHANSASDPMNATRPR